MRSQSCDILVIGSGIAGLSFALHCARFFENKKVVVLSKAQMEEGNTRYAQGGVAAVMDGRNDSYEKHIEDTLRAGDGLCKREVVALVVGEAPRAMQYLMDWGLRFDRLGQDLALGREGGHSSSRILHCKDHTGQSISHSLLEQCRQSPNIELCENRFVLRLLQDEHTKRCKGALVKDKEGTYFHKAHYVMLASGGAGQIYQLTSNPAVATGDGLALALELGAELENMAFVQFHPTVLYEPAAERPFLISEALRGFGAVLRNAKGRDFMYDYDERGSLATRDIVSRAIFNEMRQSGATHVWLDLRRIRQEAFAVQFPTIHQHLRSLGVDPAKDMLPVLPAAHYFCGGVVTDQWGQSSIAGLLACGEVACTGLHGANRLASNSLLEALVFAHQAFVKLRDHFDTCSPFSETSILPESSAAQQGLGNLRQKLQEIMTNQVGIVRREEELREAETTLRQMLNQVEPVGEQIQANELKNLLRVSLAVVEDSLQQCENRGGFFREDLCPMVESP